MRLDRNLNGSLGLSGVRDTLDQDTQAEMVEVGVPKRASLNQFDFIVDAFCKRIGPALHKIVQDEFEPVFQGQPERTGERSQFVFQPA